MRLYILRPNPDAIEWSPWYDKTFGSVVRAKTEDDAREIASQEAGCEGSEVWLDKSKSSCVHLKQAGLEGVVIVDFAAA